MGNSGQPLRSALVTGAAGFLGLQLCRLLQKDGIRVRAVDRVGVDFLTATDVPWDDFIQADLTDPESFPGLCDGIDTVFHLAAKTHATGASARDLADYEALNVVLTGRLLGQATKTGVKRFLFTSSVKVLGEGQYEPQTESDPARPESAYGRTKLEAENRVRASGLDITILRMPLIYGPGVKGNLENMIRAIARRRFPPLPDTGNRRSLVDARDVVRALKHCAEHPAAAGRTYLVTDGRWYSTFALAACIRDALDLPQPSWTIPDFLFRGAAAVGEGVVKLGLPVVFDQSVYHKLLGSACYNSLAIEQELGFSPHYQLEQSLPEMVKGILD